MLKKGILLIGMLLSAGWMMAQEPFELPLDGEFNRVTLMGNYEVTLKKGDEAKVEVINSDDDLDDDRIIAEVKGKELKLRIKMDSYKERDLEIIITYVELQEVTAKYYCVARVEDPLDAKQVELNVESGGKIDATVKDVKRLEVSIATGGSVHVDGNADVAEYKINAGGTIGAASLNATEVIANVSMGGDIICKVDQIFKVKILSGGEVSYIGDPETFEQKVTLGGTITRIKK